MPWMLTRAMLDGDAQLPEPIDKSGSLSQIGHRSEYSDLCWGEAIEIGHRPHPHVNGKLWWYRCVQGDDVVHQILASKIIAQALPTYVMIGRTFATLDPFANRFVEQSISTMFARL